MKYKIIALVTLTVCGVAAWRDLTAEPPPIERLLDAPESFPTGSEGGVRKVVLPTANLPELCQPGRMNVFAFYSDRCQASRRLCSYVASFTKLRPDVTFHMVDLGPRWRDKDCKKAYGIELGSLPHVMIYDSSGKLLAGDTRRRKDGMGLLRDWVNREFAARSPAGST